MFISLNDNTYVWLLLIINYSQDISELPNHGGSVQWPMRRFAHSSLLINNSTGPHLLVVGGSGAYDCWLFDINKRIWKQLVSINILLTLIFKIFINSNNILIVIDLFNYYL